MPGCPSEAYIGMAAFCAMDRHRVGGKLSRASALIWTHTFVSAELNHVLVGLMHGEMEHAFFRHKINVLPARYRTRNAHANPKNPGFLGWSDRLDNGRKSVASIDDLNLFAGLWNLLHRV